jgi:hypothetical protein
MLYIKTQLTDQVEIKIDLYEDEIFTTCPSCGKEFQLESEDLKQIEDWASTSISCGNEKCNKWMKEEVEKINFPQLAEGPINKTYLDDVFKFSILKFVNKNNEKTYHVFGYSELGDEVEFGIRGTLREAERLLSFYSRETPDFQIINQSNKEKK